MYGEELFAMVFVIMVFSGVFVVYMGLRQRAQQLEMQHRERMAMIERGLTPTVPEAAHRIVDHARTSAQSRWMSLGVVVVAVGLAFMAMIGIAGGSPEAGVGVGGAIAIVGVAFIVNSLVARGPLAGPPAPRDRHE